MRVWSSHTFKMYLPSRINALRIHLKFAIVSSGTQYLDAPFFLRCTGRGSQADALMENFKILRHFYCWVRLSGSFFLLSQMNRAHRGQPCPSCSTSQTRSKLSKLLCLEPGLDSCLTLCRLQHRTKPSPMRRWCRRWRAPILTLTHACTSPYQLQQPLPALKSLLHLWPTPLTATPA